MALRSLPGWRTNCQRRLAAKLQFIIAFRVESRYNKRKKGEKIMEIINITQSNFDTLVLNSDKTVLLDFWAPWCGPCRMVAPILEQIAAEREDVIIGKVNVDEEMEIAREYGIVSIPTLIVVKNGMEVDKAIGYRPKADILDLLA